MKTKAEMGVIHYKPRNAEDCLQSPGARKVWHGVASPLEPLERINPAKPWISDSWPPEL